MSDKKLFKSVIAAVMAAISVVIGLFLPEIPIVPGIEYLKMDFSDLPALVTGVAVGPWWGVLVEIIKNIFHLLKTTTFGIGELINIGIGCSMVVSLSLFTRLFSKILKKEKMSPAVYFSSAIPSLVVTILTGWLCNAALTPVFYNIMGIPCTTEIVLAGVWGSTILNAVKAALNILPFYPLYYAIYNVVPKKYRLTF